MPIITTIIVVIIINTTIIIIIIMATISITVIIIIIINIIIITIITITIMIIIAIMVTYPNSSQGQARVGDEASPEPTGAPTTFPDQKPRWTFCPFGAGGFRV